MEKKYIHYGHKRFDRRLFEPIMNGGCCGVKPYGGFWASPVDAEFGWKDWNEDSGLMSCTENNSFTFTLAPETKILVIDNVNVLDTLPKMPYDGLRIPMWVALDFEKIRDSGIDVIEYVLSSDHRLYMALYGWDCDSILIMNPDIVVEE